MSPSTRLAAVFSRPRFLPKIIVLITLALSLAFSQSAQAAWTWENVGNLVTSRSGHTATLLPNGKVLVVGGYSGTIVSGVYLDSCELYDPATGAWSPTGSLSELGGGRSGHTATLLPNGHVLVTGGHNGSVGLNLSVLYDPATGDWYPTAGFMGTPRLKHTATLLPPNPDYPKGRVLVAGGKSTPDEGVDYYLDTCELYDPTSGTWSPAGSAPLFGSLNQARSGHTATLLPDGNVLVAGGWSWVGGIDTPVASVELYYPGVGAGWGTLASMNAARADHTTTLLPNGGGVLAVAGFDGTNFLGTAECYNGASWNPLTMAYPANRAGHTATLLPDGRVLVTGGRYLTGPEGGDPLIAYMNNAQLYDYRSYTWSLADDNLNTARVGHTATLLPSGQVLVVGGENISGTLPSCELFDDPLKGLWTAPDPMGTNRTLHTATLLPSGLVLVAGGKDVKADNTVAVFDPSTSSWSSPGWTMLSPRYGHTATLLYDGTVLVAGGRNLSDSPLNSAERLSYPEGRTGAGTFTYARYYHTATLLGDGKVLVVGGVGDSGPLQSSQVYTGGTSWSSTPNPPNWPSAGHTATLLPNGRVLVVGGYDGNPWEIPGYTGYTSSAEIYHPTAGTWTPTGSLTTGGRAYHTATLLPNGKVLVAGGYELRTDSNHYYRTAELYDPADGTWTETGSLSLTIGPRAYHTATLLPSGKVLVSGGRGQSASTNKAELYDPATGLWSQTGDLATGPHHNHTTTLLPNGQVLVAGGEELGYGVLNSAELYDMGYGFQETPTSWRPSITVISPPLTTDSQLALTASADPGFRGISQGSSGNTTDSPTDYPLVQLRRLDSERIVWVPPSFGSFTDTSFESSEFQDFQTGHCLVTVFSSGIPSVSKFTKFTTTQATAVDLASFEAFPYPDKIVLEWETRTELENYGFYLWRADLGKSNYKPITDLIPALGSATQGYFYTYADTDVAAGQSYSYKLEDVSLDGKSTFHGPVTATVGYLNLLAPEDGAQLSLAAAPPQFRWEALPFDKFRLQFCAAEDFTEKLVELPQAKGKKGAGWLAQTSYTPTAKEWSAVKGLVGRKGGWLCWRVVGAYGTASSYTTEPFSFRLLPAK